MSEMFIALFSSGSLLGPAPADRRKRVLRSDPLSECFQVNLNWMENGCASWHANILGLEIRLKSTRPHLFSASSCPVNHLASKSWPRV